MKQYLLLFSLVALIFLTACSRAGDSGDVPSSSEGTEQESPISELEVIPATSPPQPTPIETAADTQPAAEESEDKKEPASATPLPTNTVAPSPIEVTYFTPAQGEGPYYTIDKPEDRDNDLTVLAGAAGAPVGQVVEFTGNVYDARGVPVSGVVIEIWQTDDSGVYLHPDDPGTEQRDRNFQFYGESISTTDGRYGFRTLLPGHYEPRPRHIHIKVRFEGNELLTTQFYFEGDPELAGEAMFNQTGGDGQHLIINLTEGQDTSGNPILIGQRDIILNVDLSG